MGSYASLAVRDSTGTIIGYQSTSTGAIAYEPGFSASGGSANYNALVNAYAQQHLNTVSSSGVYQQASNIAAANASLSTVNNPTSAAGIAAMVGANGALDLNVAKLAIAEGYSPSLISVASAKDNSVSGYAVPITTPGLAVSDIKSGIDTTPFIINSTITTTPAASQAKIVTQGIDAGTVTLKGMFGSVTEIDNAKVLVDPVTGEISAYTKDYHGDWVLRGGVSRYGAQSGEFSVTDKSGNTINLEKISPFYTENYSKASAPGANIPWSVSAGTAALSTMSNLGIGNAINISDYAKSVSGTTPASSTTFKTSTQVGASEPTAVQKASESLGTLNGLNIISAEPTGSVNVFGSTVPGSFKLQQTTTPGITSDNPVGSFVLDLIKNDMYMFNAVTAGTEPLPIIGGITSQIKAENIWDATIGGLTGVTSSKLMGGTTTESSYQATLPSPYISNKPAGYTPEPITFDIQNPTVFTEGKSNLQMLSEGSISPLLPKWEYNPAVANRQPSGVMQAGAFWAGNAAQELYSNWRTDPIAGTVTAGTEIGISYYGGKAIGAGFAAGEYGISRLIGGAAMSDIPVITTAGKLLSTPAASDVGNYIVKPALFGLMGYSTIENIVSQPTEGKQATALATSGLGLYGGFKGYQWAETKLPSVTNDFKGVEYFSGKPNVGPIESKVMATKVTGLQTYLTARSLLDPTDITTDGETAPPIMDASKIYGDIYKMQKATRFVTPELMGEPNLGEATISGKYAAPVKEVMHEQVSSLMGSTAVRGQYSPEIISESGLRVPKDFDILVQDTEAAIQSLSSKTGISETQASGIIDVHPFSDYPNYPLEGAVSKEAPSEQVDYLSGFTRSFSDPYANIARPRATSEVIAAGVTKGYTGDINYEQATAQVGRKAQGAGLGVTDPYGRGYRFEKDVYDTLSLYQAQRLSAIKSGIEPSTFSESDKAFADIMGRKITYGTEKGGASGQRTVTRSVGDIYKEYYEQAVSGVKTSTPPQIKNVPSSSPFTAGLSSLALSRLSGFGSNLPSSLQKSSAINKVPSVSSKSPSKSMLQSIYPPGSKSPSQSTRSPSPSRSQSQSPSRSQVSSSYQSSSPSRSPSQSPSSTPYNSFISTILPSPPPSPRPSSGNSPKTSSPPSSPPNPIYPTNPPPPGFPKKGSDLGGSGPSGGGSNSGFAFTEKLNIVSRRQALIGDRMDTMTGLGKSNSSKKFKMF
jgi:hypothetical protein